MTTAAGSAVSMSSAPTTGSVLLGSTQTFGTLALISGLGALTYSGAANISTTVNTTNVAGLLLFSAGSSASINATIGGNVSGDTNNTGIISSMANGTGSGANTVTLSPGVAVTSGAGIQMVNGSSTSGDLTFSSAATASVTATGTSKNGIDATTSGTGSVFVTTGAVTSSFRAVNAAISNSSSSGNLTVTVDGNVQGVLNRGVHALNDGHGLISVTGSGNVSGRTEGIFASTGSGAGITIGGSGSTTSTGSSTAISASITSGTGTVLINRSGAINAGIAGISVSSQATGDVTITGIGTIGGTTAPTTGIFVTSGGGVVINSGVITAGTTGISATGAGDVVINSGATTVGTTGISAAITRTASAGNISVTNTGAIAITGSSSTAKGLSATTAGTGNVDVTTGATITTTSGIAINTSAKQGTTTINVNNAVTGAGSTANPAISATSTTGAVNITNASTITGTGGTAIQFGNATNSLTLVGGSSIAGNVLGGTGTDTLRLGGSADSSFNITALANSGQYQNFEQFDKAGTSNWTVTGTSTFTGAATVSAGTLTVGGDITSMSGMTVNGGTLAGTGTLPAITINSGGSIQPGTLGTPGTIAVNGALTFNSGSTYVVQAGPSTTFSKINATGAANLAGGSVLVTFAAGSYTPGTYTILTATGGLNNTTFASINTIGLSGITGARNPHLSYDANDVFLTLDVAAISPSLPSGSPTNASNVARAIDANGNGSSTTGFSSLYGMSGSQLTNALQQLSGEAGASGGVQGGTQLTNSFLSLMLNGFTGDRNGDGGFGPANGYAAEAQMKPEAADAYAAINKAAPRQVAFNDRWNVWGSAYGGQANARGDVNVGSNDTRTTAFGFAAGADKKLSPDLTVGFALAGGNTRWSVANGFGGGNSDVFQAGAYMSKRFGASYVSGAVAYAHHWMHTDRTVSVGGTTNNITAGFGANNIGGRIEAGHRLFNTQVVSVTPYAALQVQAFYLPGYSESGSTFALSYNSRTATATRAELGAWFDSRQVFGSTGKVNVFARAAWAHDWRSDASATATFQALPGSGFVVNGAAAPKDLALLTLGATARLSDRVSLTGKFDGEFAGGFQSYAGTGTLRYAFQ